MTVESVLFILILLAGFYMAWNIGANDVANAMGTSVGSGALTLRQAVCVAAVLEFVGAFFFGSHVSETIQQGIIDTSSFSSQPLLVVYGMLAALIAAGFWLQIASYYGWPVSTTHTIVGAIIGFGVIVGGWDAVYWDEVGFIAGSWVISPFIGGILSFLIFIFLRKFIFYSSTPLEAAKKLTPLILFFVFAVLTFILTSSGFSHVMQPLNHLEKAGFSTIAGGCAATIGYVSIRFSRWGAASPVRYADGDADILTSLEKAKKHLLKALESISAEKRYEMSILLQEVDHLKHRYEVPLELLPANSEYTAIEKIFGYLQILSACMMAFAHGANDVANAIGPLSAAVSILKEGTLTTSTVVPTWALALGGVGIVIGLATWGWRVMETIGKKLTELTPSRGFSAEFGAALTIVLASGMGLPISTTHVLVGSVLGVGLARGLEALNLAMMRDIAISWLVTVPAGAILCIVFYEILKGLLMHFGI